MDFVILIVRLTTWKHQDLLLACQAMLLDHSVVDMTTIHTTPAGRPHFSIRTQRGSARSLRGLRLPLPRQLLRLGNLVWGHLSQLMRQIVAHDTEKFFHIEGLLKRLTRTQQLGRI